MRTKALIAAILLSTGGAAIAHAAVQDAPAPAPAPTPTPTPSPTPEPSPSPSPTESPQA